MGVAYGGPGREPCDVQTPRYSAGSRRESAVGSVGVLPGVGSGGWGRGTEECGMERGGSDDGGYGRGLGGGAQAGASGSWAVRCGRRKLEIETK